MTMSVTFDRRMVQQCYDSLIDDIKALESKKELALFTAGTIGYIAIKNNDYVGMLYETDKLVTIQFTEEGYSGGAHGWFTVEGVTLRKPDGRKLVTEDILLSPSRYAPDEDWAKIMNDDLKKCLDVEGKSDDGLMDVLQLMNPEMGIPFPETEPYFTKDGLFFPYQQYEICSYAQGMPSFTIPYDKLGKYLNTTGKNLIK